MLLRALVMLALYAALSQTLLHGAAALATSALHRRATEAAQAAIETARAQTLEAIGRAMQSGTPMIVPTPSTSCAVFAATACAFTVTTSVTPLATPANVTGSCPETACTIIMQAHDAVAEGRVTLRIDAAAGSPMGAPLARRSRVVSFRTFLVPPYAALAGSTDATLDDVANGGNGDDGGSNVDGTLIDVVYQHGTSTPIPANVWNAASQHPPISAPPWDR